MYLKAKAIIVEKSFQNCELLRQVSLYWYQKLLKIKLELYVLSCQKFADLERAFHKVVYDIILI